MACYFESRATAQSDWEFRGAASCAASGCHGGPRAGVSSVHVARGSEYPLWLESDPHARSWLTMNSPQATEILTKLGALREGRIVEPRSYRNCLTCHATDHDVELQGEGIMPVRPSISEGVGCEACHGAAEGWYDRHYQGPESIDVAIASRGMIPTKSLVDRARMCAKCHVGSDDRDMNHDLIAAGHPALYFDMAAYHEAYNKHWRDDEAESTAFRSQLWLAGQIANFEAELELIQARVQRKTFVSCWPEFAQLQCTDCHQQLLGRSGRVFNNSKGNPAASVVNLSQNTSALARPRMWNLNGWSVLANALDSGRIEGGSLKYDKISQEDFETLLALLRDPKQSQERISESAARVQSQWSNILGKQTTRDALERWDASHQTAVGLTLLRALDSPPQWEPAAMAYLSVWALDRREPAPAWTEALATLRSGLLFPPLQKTPAFPLSSSKDTDRLGEQPTSETFRQALRVLIDSLETNLP